VAAVPILPTERPATPTALPVVVTGPTTRMTDAEFKDEVARRVSQELRKIDQEMRKRTPPDVANAAAALKARPPASVVTVPARAEPPASDAAVEAPPPPVKIAVAPPPEPSPAPESALPESGSPAPAPTSPAAAAPAAAASVVEVAPKISRVIKPLYPQVALRAHIGGIVLLRVLVSETGEPVEVQVLKGVAGGLTESAVAAVRNWRFQPATRGGSPVRGWTTIPIPFEP
jgi:TonB family protein